MRFQIVSHMILYGNLQLGALPALQRCASTVATTKKEYQQHMNVYHKERAAWKRQMTELRKQWIAEHQQKEELARAAKHVFSSEAGTGRDGVSPHEAERRKLEKAVRDAEMAYEVAVASLKKAERATLRQEIVQEQDAARLAGIQEVSRNWITKENLEQRILAALDTPVSMGPAPLYPPFEEQPAVPQEPSVPTA